MDADKMIRDLRAAGFEPHRYSGRAMFGREYVGVKYYTFLERRQIENVVDPECQIESNSDELGRGRIVYWPHARWPEDQEDTTDQN